MGNCTEWASKFTPDNDYCRKLQKLCEVEYSKSEPTSKGKGKDDHIWFIVIGVVFIICLYLLIAHENKLFPFHSR
jgi:hypothetical protein